MDGRFIASEALPDAAAEAQMKKYIIYRNDLFRIRKTSASQNWIVDACQLHISDNLHQKESHG